MEQYIFDKNNGLWYERQGDHYIRCLTVQADEEKPIGLWGGGKQSQLLPYLSNMLNLS